MQKRLFALLFLAATHVCAQDLGVQGTVFPITEVDMRRLLVESAARADWDMPRKELAEKAKTYTQHLPQYNLPEAGETRTQYVDPSIVLQSDIYGPVKGADGKYHWQVLVKKGTRANPLDKITPRSRFLFFDGTNPKQVAFVKAVLKKHPLEVSPIETSGDPKVLALNINRPVFYANPKLLDRMHVTATPTLVGVGQGAYRTYLAVTQMAEPFRVEVVDAAWYGLPLNKNKNGANAARKTAP